MDTFTFWTFNFGIIKCHWFDYKVTQWVENEEKWFPNLWFLRPNLWVTTVFIIQVKKWKRQFQSHFFRIFCIKLCRVTIANSCVFAAMLLIFTRHSLLHSGVISWEVFTHTRSWPYHALYRFIFETKHTNKHYKNVIGLGKMVELVFFLYNVVTLDFQPISSPETSWFHT